MLHMSKKEKYKNLHPTSWFTTTLPPQFGEKNPNENKLLQWIKDITCPYYSKLCPIFSCQISSPVQINKYEVVLLRDGFVPLMWFFKNNPTPNNFSCYFLVDYDFRDFIPLSWAKQIHFYRTQNTTPIKTPSRLLITGLLSDSYLSQDYLEHMVRLVRSNTKLAPEILVLYSHDPFYLNETQSYHALVYSISQFGPMKKSWSVEDIKGHRDFSDYYLLDLNEKLLYSDSYIVHKLLKKGAQLLPNICKVPRAQGHTVSLSPNHSMHIITDNAAPETKYARFEEEYNSIPQNDKKDLPSNLGFPPIFFKFAAKHYRER